MSPLKSGQLFSGRSGAYRRLHDRVYDRPNILSKGLTGFISCFVFRDIFFLWESSLGGIVLCLLTMADGLVVVGSRLLFSNTVIGGRAVVELIIIQAIMNIPLGLLVKPGQKDAEMEQVWSRRRKYN